MGDSFLGPRHCEERSDEAIQTLQFKRLDCFAEPVIGPATSGRTRWLAMTKYHTARAGTRNTEDQDDIAAFLG
jgi:hypothetical protein